MVGNSDMWLSSALLTRHVKWCTRIDQNRHYQVSDTEATTTQEQITASDSKLWMGSQA